MQPDDIDWKIIDILKKGYVPNNTIAKEVGVSEGTVRSRIKKLKDANILTIRALINPDVLENKQLALIAMNLSDPHLIDKRAKEIAQLDNVLTVSLSSGRYDLMAEVLVNSNKGLVNFLTHDLATIPGITAIESFIQLKNYRKFV